MEKMKFESADILKIKFDKIAKIFPECLTETRDAAGNIKQSFDCKLLNDILNGNVPDNPEAYNFTWVGKNAARAEAYSRSNMTLRPCIEESVNWDTTQNLYIEGNNLEVLKLLQKSYMHKVKMIYIDPPYNTGHDFIYRDRFEMDADEYAKGVDLFDEEGNRKFSENSDSNPRFHSDWCSMIYSRLLLARDLLTDNGVIFISIDDNEQANLKKICDEVFGTDNFIGAIAWRRFNSQANVGMFATVKDTILIYSKDIKSVSFGRVPLSETAKKEYQYKDERGIYARRPCIDSVRGHYKFNVTCPNGTVLKDNWTIKEADFQRLNKANLIHWPANGGNPMQKIYLADALKKGQIACDFWGSEYGNNKISVEEVKTLFGFRAFDFPKPTLLMYNLLSLGAFEKDAIIMDFFSGSATTAHAVMQLNAEDGGKRKFIMVQLSEECAESSEAFKAGYKNICEIGKERIRRAGNKIKADNPLTTTELDVGFRVLKLDTTNMNDVYYSPDEYSQDMLAGLESNIKDDRTALDLLFGCLIDWGVELGLPYTSEEFEGATIHNYNEGDLIACFDMNISSTVIEHIAKMQPLRAVFRDGSFTKDSAKINAGEIFKLYSPNTHFKVI